MLFYLMIYINYSYFLVNCTLECYKGPYSFHLIVFGLKIESNLVWYKITISAFFFFAFAQLTLAHLFIFTPTELLCFRYISRIQHWIHFVIQAKYTFLKIGEFNPLLFIDWTDIFGFNFFMLFYTCFIFYKWCH